MRRVSGELLFQGLEAACSLAGQASSGDLLPNMAPKTQYCAFQNVKKVDFLLCSSHQINCHKQKRRRGLWEVMDLFITLIVGMVIKAYAYVRSHQIVCTYDE